jgi:hypothetical protein
MYLILKNGPPGKNGRAVAAFDDPEIIVHVLRILAERAKAEAAERAARAEPEDEDEDEDPEDAPRVLVPRAPAGAPGAQLEEPGEAELEPEAAEPEEPRGEPGA